METKQDVSDQQQSLNLIPSLWCTDQTPRDSRLLIISCDFCNRNADWKEPFGFLPWRAGGPLTPRLPNYMFCLLIMCLSLIQVFLTRWAGRSSTGSSLLLNYFSICWLYLSVLSLESLGFCLVFLSSVLLFSIILKNVVTFFTWLLIHQSLHAGCCLLTALTHPCPFKTNTNFLWNSRICHGRKAFCEEFWTYLLPVLFSTQLE